MRCILVFPRDRVSAATKSGHQARIRSLYSHERWIQSRPHASLPKAVTQFFIYFARAARCNLQTHDHVPYVVPSL